MCIRSPPGPIGKDFTEKVHRVPGVPCQPKITLSHAVVRAAEEWRSGGDFPPLSALLENIKCCGHHKTIIIIVTVGLSWSRGGQVSEGAQDEGRTEQT